MGQEFECRMRLGRRVLSGKAYLETDHLLFRGEERVKILREAYNKALKDAELMDEVKRSRLDMEPNTGQQIEVLYKGLMEQPPSVVDLVKKLEVNYASTGRVL